MALKHAVFAALVAVVGASGETTVNGERNAQKDGSSATKAPAGFLSAQGAQSFSSTWQWCSREGDVCHPWKWCCDNMRCEQLLGGSDSVCMRPQPQCVAEHGVCGGPGQLTASCCGNLQCQRLLGGDQMRCEQPPQQQCVSEHGPCGGPGQLTVSCCGDLQCRPAVGGGEMYCTVAMLESREPVLELERNGTEDHGADMEEVGRENTEMNVTEAADVTPSFAAVAGASESSCVREHETCEWWQHCCDGMKCERLLGASSRQCVREQSQCVTEDGVCGGPGQWPQPCCGNLVCQRLLGGGYMECKQPQPPCVQQGAVCGGPGQLTQSCCGGSTCQTVLGGSIMKCV